MQMKRKYGIKENRPLADFLPTLTIAAKNLATEMTNYNVTEKDIYGEESITDEHVDNNLGVRDMLNKRGIKPENLKPAEDLKKLDRRDTSESKKIANNDKLPKEDNEHTKNYDDIYSPENISLLGEDIDIFKQKNIGTKVLNKEKGEVASCDLCLIKFQSLADIFQATYLLGTNMP